MACATISAHGFALFRGAVRTRGLPPDLLVAALDGAIALAQVDGIAVLVAQHLNLDMPGLFADISR